MATKQKDITLKIQPGYCSIEIKNALQKIGSFGGYNAEAKMFYGTYKYLFQNVELRIILRSDKGQSKIRFIGKTDDLIGTGANKAIRKLTEYLISVEPQYKVDYEIDDAFSAILKGDYFASKEILLEAYKQRPNVFKVLFGLGLCFLYEKLETKGEEYINQAITNIPEGEKRTKTTRRVVSILWSLKQYLIAEKLFKPIAKNPKAETKDKLFHMLLLLNSKNYSDLAIELTKEFPQNINYVLKLLKDPSVESDCRKEFITKLPALIKAYRSKVVFNILAPSIKYLIANNNYAIPKRYRSSLDKFYKSKDIDIINFIKLYNSIINLLKDADIEAENLLKIKSTLTLKGIKENASLINIFNKNRAVFPNKKELDYISKEIEDCASNLSSSDNFIQKHAATEECKKLNIKSKNFLEKHREELPKFISKFIEDKKPTKAEKLLKCYQDVYNATPLNIEELNSNIDQLKVINKKRRKIYLVSSLVILAIIFISSKLISGPEPSDTSTEKLITEKKPIATIQEEPKERREPEEPDESVLVSGNSVGSFTIGMPIPMKDELNNYNINEEIIVQYTDEGSYDETQFSVTKWGDKILHLVPAYDYHTRSYNDNIGEIVVHSNIFKTLKGISVNSTIEEFAEAYPDYKIYYTYVSDKYWIETDDFKAQFILSANDFIGDLKIDSDMILLDIKDFHSNSKISKIRIF